MSRKRSAPKRAASDREAPAVRELRARIAELRTFRVGIMRSARTAEALQASIDSALQEAFGPNTADYQRYALAIRFSPDLVFVARNRIQGVRQQLAAWRDRSIKQLEDAIAVLERNAGVVIAP